MAGHFHLDWAAGLKVCLESTLRKCLRLYSYRHVSFLITSSKSPIHASVRNVIIIFEGSLRKKLFIDIRSFDALIASKTVKHVRLFTDQTISHLIEVAGR